MISFRQFLTERSAKGHYELTGSRYTFHLENNKGGRFLVADNDNSLRLKIGDDEKPGNAINRIVQRFTSYNNSRVEKGNDRVDMESFVRSIFPVLQQQDHNEAFLKTRDDEIRAETNKQFVFGRLDIGGGETVRLYHFNDKRAGLFVYDSDTYTFRRINSSKIEKISDKGYRLNGKLDDIKLRQRLLMKDYATYSEEDRKSKQSEKNWKMKEKKIRENLSKLLGDRSGKSLVVVDPNGNPVQTPEITVQSKGGGQWSDVQVVNKDSKKSFFIESKLNYESSEYFKFRLQLKNGKISHSADKKYKDRASRLDEIFGTTETKSTDTVIGILTGGGGSSEIKDQVKDFYENITTFLTRTSEWLERGDSNEIQAIKDEFFGSAKPIYTDENDINKMEFPKDLVPLANCFIQYIGFVKTIGDSDDESSRTEMGLRDQLIQNLSDLLETDVNGVEKFVDECVSNRMSSGDVLTFIYQRVLSSVKSKKGNVGTMMLFRSEGTNIIPGLIDKINDYYVRVHDARYIEIGTNPFGDGSVFNESSWKSDIYILEPGNVQGDRAQYDPLELLGKENQRDNNLHVFTMEQMKERLKTVSVSCQVSDDLDSFSLKIFLGGKSNQDSKTISNASGSSDNSFEGLTSLTLHTPLRF